MIRRIPDSWFQAASMSTTMDFLVTRSGREPQYRLAPGQRRLGWFVLPDFQRPPVWTQQQQARFVESALMGLPIGAFVWNDAPGTRFDQWLIDGQQRVTAIYNYMAGAFPVLGYRFSELTEVDHRRWGWVAFPCLKTNLKDEAQLREVYDRLAYGGTPHEPKGSRRPYRAECGAVHHENDPGFLFTVDPPKFAADVADALNKAAR